MTIDEAIQHCEEVTDTPCFTDEEARCYSEHRQLAEWLKELKAYKEQDSDAISNLAMSHILNHEVKWINERMTREDNPNTCGDVISRQAVLEIQAEYAEHMKSTKFWKMRDDIKALPSVTPQQSTGWWKAFTHSAFCGYDEDGEPIWKEVTVYHCNLCNRRTVIKEKYCPSCGAKMGVCKE